MHCANPSSQPAKVRLPIFWGVCVCVCVCLCSIRVIAKLNTRCMVAGSDGMLSALGRFEMWRETSRTALVAAVTQGQPLFQLPAAGNDCWLMPAGSRPVLRGIGEQSVVRRLHLRPSTREVRAHHAGADVIALHSSTAISWESTALAGCLPGFADLLRASWATRCRGALVPQEPTYGRNDYVPLLLYVFARQRQVWPVTDVERLFG